MVGQLLALFAQSQFRSGASSPPAPDAAELRPLLLPGAHPSLALSTQPARGEDVQEGVEQPSCLLMPDLGEEPSI